MTIQQQEALRYFRTHADGWRSKATGLGSTEVNIIEQRNDYVLRVADQRPVTAAFLDVGCGTGELVCDAARRGIASVGVDYAEEMIALASNTARDAALPGARFVCSSIFDFDMPAGSYDLISANGFIEYISQDQMLTFFDRVTEALAPGGSFVVGSRNRLFNLVSMNEFSLQELEAGTIDALLREAVRWNTSTGTVPEVTRAQCAPLQAADTRHTHTGIDVVTRFQYSPFQLIQLLQERSLRPIEVSPVHIHGVPPSFGQGHPEIHTAIANLLQPYGSLSTQLLVQASSFMLHVMKAES